ncbi:MAG: helix-turn-helix domain-containing protein [Pseudonocardia sp.]
MAAVPKKKPGPTLQAQWLGQQLRALRASTEMTLRQAGEYLQRDPSMVSRFETAEYPIRRGDVLALLDLYNVSEERTRDGLLRLSDDVWRKGWWDGYANTVDRQYIDLPWLEAAPTGSAPTRRCWSRDCCRPGSMPRR